MKIRMLTILACSGLLLTGALAFASETTDCSKEDHYPLITKSELKTVAENKEAVIIDVNSKDSFKKAHVPGAIHYGSHEKDLQSLLPSKKDQLVVAYCGAEKCDAWKKAAEKACKLGYTNVKHFKEGIKGWVEKD
jgi:rhodanese-related sulfurtransferase